MVALQACTGALWPTHAARAAAVWRLTRDGQDVQGRMALPRLGCLAADAWPYAHALALLWLARHVPTWRLRRAEPVALPSVTRSLPACPLRHAKQLAPDSCTLPASISHVCSHVHTWQTKRLREVDLDVHIQMVSPCLFHVRQRHAQSSERAGQKSNRVEDNQLLPLGVERRMLCGNCKQVGGSQAEAL